MDEPLMIKERGGGWFAFCTWLGSCPTKPDQWKRIIPITRAKDEMNRPMRTETSFLENLLEIELSDSVCCAPRKVNPLDSKQRPKNNCNVLLSNANDPLLQWGINGQQTKIVCRRRNESLYSSSSFISGVSHSSASPFNESLQMKEPIEWLGGEWDRQSNCFVFAPFCRLEAKCCCC